MLLDRPNEDMDRMLSEHVMALHSGRARTGGARLGAMAPGAWGGDGGTLWDGPGGGMPFMLRLRQGAVEVGDGCIPAYMLRKYIAYARQYVHPTLSRAASDALKKFYLSLRSEQRRSDSVPVTARQLESLVRIAEARAKMELRDEVTEADALDAIEVVKETITFHTLTGRSCPPLSSFEHTYLGVHHLLSARSPRCARLYRQHGRARRRRRRRAREARRRRVEEEGAQRILVGAGQRVSPEAGREPPATNLARRALPNPRLRAARPLLAQDAFFTTDQMREIWDRSGMQCPYPDFHDFVDALNSHNIILKKGPRLWKLQSSSYAQRGYSQFSQAARGTQR